MKARVIAGFVGLAVFAAACSPGTAATAVEGPSSAEPTVAMGLETPSPSPEMSPATPEPSAPNAGPVRFRIDPDQSEARFVIDEILAGSPKTVVGATRDVTGGLEGDFSDPAGVQLGPVVVDMSTLRTDNNFRNRALHDAILQTGIEANRYATFQATAINGIPETIALGTPYPVTITGDLTIHGVTRLVTFQGEVTPVSAERLEGSAAVSLLYADFDVRILRLPQQVASVSDGVRLEIDFVAEVE